MIKVFNRTKRASMTVRRRGSLGGIFVAWHCVDIGLLIRYFFTTLVSVVLVILSLVVTNVSIIRAMRSLTITHQKQHHRGLLLLEKLLIRPGAVLSRLVLAGVNEMGGSGMTMTMTLGRWRGKVRVMLKVAAVMSSAVLRVCHGWSGIVVIVLVAAKVIAATVVGDLGIAAAEPARREDQMP